MMTQEKKEVFTPGELEILLRIERLEIEVKYLSTNVQKYVRREEFEPIQRIVYGLVSLVLIAVCGSLITLVIIK